MPALRRRRTVIQLKDGAVDDGNRFEPPVIHVDIGEALTPEQTRQLAQQLIEAAADVEQMSAATA